MFSSSSSSRVRCGDLGDFYPESVTAFSAKAAVDRSQAHTSSQQRLRAGHAVSIPEDLSHSYTEVHTANPYFFFLDFFGW